MSSADVLPNKSANTSYFTTVRSRSLSAYSHDESFPILASVVDQHIDRNIPSANSRTLTRDKFLIDPRVESRESKGRDTKLTDVAKSQEALNLRAWYCTGMTMEMERNGPFCNLADRPPIRSDPNILEGVCKSKHKPGIMDIWDGHVGVVYRLWKNYNERAQIISGRANKWGEGDGKSANGKGKDGNEKKGVDRFVTRDWMDVQYVSEFEVRKKYKRMDFIELASFSAPTLDLRGAIGSVGIKLEDCSPKRTMFFGEVFKPTNRVCRAISMERLEPLRCVKNVDYFKQAIRDVVLAHHLLFIRELQILHRDISADNLMIRYNQDGTVCGVLIDFDLATTSNEDTEDPIRMRTRSRLFMAWELLESDPPPIHLERFDWESFFYVICWIGCRYSEGKEANNSILSDWYNPNDRGLIDAKRRWLQEPVGFTSFYIHVAQDWVVDLAAMFEEGTRKKAAFRVVKPFARLKDPINDEKFDEETSGAPITWNRFWGILKK